MKYLNTERTRPSNHRENGVVHLKKNGEGQRHGRKRANKQGEGILEREGKWAVRVNIAEKVVWKGPKGGSRGSRKRKKKKKRPQHGEENHHKGLEKK